MHLSSAFNNILSESSSYLHCADGEIVILPLEEVISVEFKS